jgi:molecular chaperone HscB
MSSEATSTKISTPATCWSCGAALTGSTFCAACGKIQPLARGGDYFALLGLPRKLSIEEAEIDQRFHTLSWKLHPDNFVRASEQERELSLERFSQINDAYRTLRNRISRVEYLLASAGLRQEGKNKQQAPPELLEEVFELNESLDELRAARTPGADPAEVSALARRLQAARGNFEEKLGVVDAELELLGMEWDRVSSADAAAAPGAAGAESAEQRKLMGRMNEVLNRRSYIRNLVQSVQKELAEA